MTPFLECDIWSIENHSFDGFYMIEKIYKYNSLCDNINDTYTIGFYQIPEFEIYNLHLLNGVDLQLVNDNRIPIIERSEQDQWGINLFHYNDYIKNHIS